MTQVTTTTATRHRAIQRAIPEWRAALIDVGGRNPLLYFKREAATTVDLRRADRAAVDALLNGDAVRLTRLFPDALQHATALTACRKLAAKQRVAAEEYGISIAHLALGLTTWSSDAMPPQADEDDPDDLAEDGPRPAASRRPGSGRAKAPSTPAAPLILRSLTLTPQPGNAAFELTLDGEPQLNGVLAHLLATRGAQLTEDDLLAAGDTTSASLETIFDRARDACRDVDGFRVTEELYFGAFDYSKQPMVNDFDDLDALAASDLVAAFAGDEEARDAVRAVAADVDEAASDHVPVAAEFLVLDADASQSYVVNAAVAGRNLVVQGPPGTGKSQTIANIVASLVAEGRSVLFVAQKRAAIEAVLERLTGVGLDDLVLDMFAAKGSRKIVVGEIKRALEGQTSVRPTQTSRLHDTLQRSRDRLVRHVGAVHDTPRAGGQTLFSALGEAYAAASDIPLTTRLPESVMAAWTSTDLDALAAAIGELAERGGLRPDLTTRPGWSPSAVTSLAVFHAASEQLIAARTALLPAFASAAAVVGPPLGVHDVSAADAQSLATVLVEATTVARHVPGAFDPETDDALLHRLLATTSTQYRRTHHVDVGYFERRRLRRVIAALAAPDSDPMEAAGGPHALLLLAQRVRRAWVARGLAGPPRAVPGASAFQEATSALVAGLTALAPFVQHMDVMVLPSPTLAEALAALAADREGANYPPLFSCSTALREAGAATVVDELRRVVATGGTAGDPEGRDGARAAAALRHVAAMSVVERAWATDPALAGVSGRDLQAAVASFCEHEAQHFQANAARVRRRAAERLRRVIDANGDQHTLVHKQTTLKRSFAPVRQIVATAPDVVLAAKPVWAMSPLQVSQFLPTAPLFDVVIFDEASQVRPADAIGSLARGRQVIVAGDKHQLPPTDFFTKVIDAADVGEEDVEDGDEGDEGGGTTVRRVAGEPYTRGAESILDAAELVWLGQSRTLSWHYRSRDERLIATSNASVYDHRLTTLPCADGREAIVHEVVPDDVGRDDRSTASAAQVRRIVELVCEHARMRPQESLGVITFGVAQANRISAALDQAFAAEPELLGVLNSTAREPFFVKNIERVQGDERDAVILSFDYGKTADGRVSLQWGPLLNDEKGGYRRINVAISRAKQRLTLVTRFAADDMREDAHPSAGYALVYRFVRFMASGGTEIDVPYGTRVPLNAFEQDIYEHLLGAGLDVVPQLGVGRYRLDFAVRHPQHPGRFVLAIEADGASYHSGLVARERDRLRQQLLERRGWRFHRIWSTDWFNQPEQVLDRVVADYRAALDLDAVGVPMPREELGVVVEAPAVARPSRGW